MHKLNRFRFGLVRALLCSVSPPPGGGGGSQEPSGGGGTGGTGGTGSSGGGGGSTSTMPQSTMQYLASRAGAVLYSIPVPVPTAGKPVNGPPMAIPPGYYVEVGPLPGNTGLAYFSQVGPQATINGPRELVSNANLVPRQIDARNLSDIWVNAAVNGEGVQFTVRKTV